MNGMSTCIRRIIGIVPFVSVLFAHPASGDSLTARPYKDTFLVYEMIVVQMTLHLDEAFLPDLKDPHEAAKQLARLHRRLFIELRERNGKKVSQGFLAGITFLPSDQSTKEFRATGLGFLGQADRKGKGFEHWDQPGYYVLVVCDKENRLESNEMGLTLEFPEGPEFEAAQIFEEGGVDAMSLVVQQKYRQEQTLDIFARLARDYPKTAHGKYAIVSLALIRWKETFREHNIKGGREVWGPVVDELAKSSRLFDGAHPLRERVLFDLARAQGFAGDLSEARRTMGLVSTEFPHGELGQKAKAALKELDD